MAPHSTLLGVRVGGGRGLMDGWVQVKELGVGVGGLGVGVHGRDEATAPRSPSH